MDKLPLFLLAALLSTAGTARAGLSELWHHEFPSELGELVPFLDAADRASGYLLHFYDGQDLKGVTVQGQVDTLPSTAFPPPFPPDAEPIARSRSYSANRRYLVQPDNTGTVFGEGFVLPLPLVHLLAHDGTPLAQLGGTADHFMISDDGQVFATMAGHLSHAQEGAEAIEAVVDFYDGSGNFLGTISDTDVIFAQGALSRSGTVFAHATQHDPNTLKASAPSGTLLFSADLGQDSVVALAASSAHVAAVRMNLLDAPGAGLLEIRDTAGTVVATHAVGSVKGIAFSDDGQHVLVREGRRQVVAPVDGSPAWTKPMAPGYAASDLDVTAGGTLVIYSTSHVGTWPYTPPTTAPLAISVEHLATGQPLGTLTPWRDDPVTAGPAPRGPRVWIADDGLYALVATHKNAWIYAVTP